MSSYINPILSRHIENSEIETILELGSRDLIDAISMLNFYNPKKIYSFECNPESIIVCESNNIHADKIELVKKAVSNLDGNINFYATDMENSVDKNIGASSALLHRDQITYIQKKIMVESIRLDTFMKKNNIDKIDLLCMDLQGYEKIAFDSLGELTSSVGYVISEVSFQSFYHQDVLFEDFIEFMNYKGFQHVETLSHGSFGDALFINKKLKK